MEKIFLKTGLSHQSSTSCVCIVNNKCMPHVWLEECWKAVLACQGNTAKITSTNPVHSTQQKLGKLNSSILISGFISRDFSEQDSFSYIFHLTFLIRLKVFSVYKSFYVIRNWAHQPPFPIETVDAFASWRSEFLYWDILHMSTQSPCFLFILCFRVKIFTCLFLFVIIHKER